MRLTLRTLLAWLDDTLPPTQVREIGRQVAESTYAQELVERIHRVTRQRRLTVPSRSGPEGSDPNIVASYVDNDLDAEQVGEYEKKCLGSDVNLAEVACVHQILSLLGQKVHVPAEAKARMYQLVRGRESVPVSRRDGVKPVVRVPVTEPIQPWVAPAPPPRHWLERFGPVAGCLALVALLGWSAYRSLTPPVDSSQPVAVPQQPTGVGAPLAQATAPPGTTIVPGEGQQKAGGAAIGELAAADSKEAPAVPKETATEAASANPADRSAPSTVKAADNSAKPKAEPAAGPSHAVPAGSVGVVDHVSGVLLRFNAEKREWERIAEGTALATSDRLLCVEPFRARIVVAKTPITLIGETQVLLTSKTAAEPPAFELTDGRALIDAAAPSGSLKVAYAGLTASIDRPSHGSLGVERVSVWHYGLPATQPPPLAIHVHEGEDTVTLAGTKETLTGPGSLMADSTGRFLPRTKKELPTWMTEAEPSPKSQELGKQFLEQFSKDRPVLADIVLATESDSPVTKKLAILAVKAMGDLSFLTPILSHGDRSARQSAIAALAPSSPGEPWPESSYAQACLKSSATRPV